MDLLAQVLVNGMLLGGLCAVTALGLALVWRARSGSTKELVDDPEKSGVLISGFETRPADGTSVSRVDPT